MAAAGCKVSEQAQLLACSCRASQSGRVAPSEPESSSWLDGFRLPDLDALWASWLDPIANRLEAWSSAASSGKRASNEGSKARPIFGRGMA
jgi:hypothetical protein